MNSKELSLTKDTTCSGIGAHEEIKSINNLLALLNVAVGATTTNNNNGDQLAR